MDFASIEPFVAHVPTARLRIPYRKLAKLHPAQIADLVEAASHDEGEEIIEAVGQDLELEADVFEELDAEHQLEFIRSRSDAEAARLLATMAPDDGTTDRGPGSGATSPGPRPHAPCPSAQDPGPAELQPRDCRRSHEPRLPLPARADPALDGAGRHPRSAAPPEALAVIFASGPDGRVTGSASVVLLVKAEPTAPLGTVVSQNPAYVHPDWDVHQVVRKMSDFNLTVAPVMDHDHRMIGVITVDDVLELLLPTGWRREFGMAGAED